MFKIFSSLFYRSSKKDSVVQNLAFQGIRGEIVYRDFVKTDLKKFSEQVVNPNTEHRSFTMAVLTDTHAKDANSNSFYGINGLMHTQELNIFDSNPRIDMKVHLGDAIDGSDNPENSKTLLRLITRSLNNSKLPFAMVKGNHDDNDKFDEHTLTKAASFGEDTYRQIVNPLLFDQPQIKYESEETGLFYFDKGNIRAIFLNTSDVPYKLNVRGIKKYDVKKVRALCQKQFEELVKILENSANRRVIVYGHTPLLDSKGESGLTYNGRTVHELFVAFNKHLKGEVNNGLVGDFAINTKFDFSNIRGGKISAYICGHKHIESNYRFDDIDYVLLNCSALMGKNHNLTTKYNKVWDRHLNTVTEYAGYIVDINPATEKLSVYGYGAASTIRVFDMR